VNKGQQLGKGGRVVGSFSSEAKRVALCRDNALRDVEYKPSSTVELFVCDVADNSCDSSSSSSSCFSFPPPLLSSPLHQIWELETVGIRIMCWTCCNLDPQFICSQTWCKGYDSSGMLQKPRPPPCVVFIVVVVSSPPRIRSFSFLRKLPASSRQQQQLVAPIWTLVTPRHYCIEKKKKKKKKKLCFFLYIIIIFSRFF